MSTVPSILPSCESYTPQNSSSSAAAGMGLQTILMSRFGSHAAVDALPEDFRQHVT